MYLEFGPKELCAASEFD